MNVRAMRLWLAAEQPSIRRLSVAHGGDASPWRFRRSTAARATFRTADAVIRYAVLVTLLLFAGNAIAGVPKQGPHGGSVVAMDDATYELVIEADKIALYLATPRGEPMQIQAWSGSVQFLRGSVRHGLVRLSPAGEGVLRGRGGIHLEAGVVAIVTLRDASGRSFQLRFER